MSVGLFMRIKLCESGFSGLTNFQDGLWKGFNGFQEYKIDRLKNKSFPRIKVGDKDIKGKRCYFFLAEKKGSCSAAKKAMAHEAEKVA